MSASFRATLHIVWDKNISESFDQDFDAKSDFIELAEDSRSNNAVHARGKATMHVLDSQDKQREIDWSWVSGVSRP